MGGKRAYTNLITYPLPVPPPKIEPVPEQELLAEVDALVEAERRLLYRYVCGQGEPLCRAERDLLVEARAYRDALWDTIRRMKAPQAHHRTRLPAWLKVEAR